MTVGENKPTNENLEKGQEANIKKHKERREQLSHPLGESKTQKEQRKFTLHNPIPNEFDCLDLEENLSSALRWKGYAI